MLKVKRTYESIWTLLETVKDPEIPVLSILDLGVVRSVTRENNVFLIKITPTYSGCPAMDMIAFEIKNTLEKEGIPVEVKLVLAPAWTTAWITESGKEKMKAYGIAPPLEPEADKAALTGAKRLVNCPNCQSTNTKMISAFGSTACKALFKCEDCLEPFDYFKCLK